LQYDLDKMEHLLRQEVFSKIPLVNEIAEYLMDNPGKGLRSMLTFLSARVCNPEPASKVITLAACVELIHMATLLHDDVVDESDVRRNRPCVHRVWGNQASILMGDFLFSRAFEMVMAVESWPLLKILSKTIASMAEGELLQMSVQENIDEHTYFQIIQAKTATLFSAACKGGALIVSASSKETLALESYGYNLGILFQLTDDLLDGDLNDFRFFSHNSVLEKVEFYRKASLNALEIFPESVERTMLEDLVNFCLHRKS